MKLFNVMMIAGVAASLAACAYTPDDRIYVEDVEEQAVVEYEAPKKVVKTERTTRIERAYNDSLRK